MQRFVASTPTKIQVFAMIAIFSQACGLAGNTTASPGTTCSANQVVVQVYSGSIKRVCGCQEGQGTFSGSAFTCTVARGTTVLFYYPGISMSHQISISGASTGALATHTAAETNPSDAYTLSSSGTYNFYDSYQSGNVFGTFTSL